MQFLLEPLSPTAHFSLLTEYVQSHTHLPLHCCHPGPCPHPLLPSLSLAPASVLNAAARGILLKYKPDHLTVLNTLHGFHVPEVKVCNGCQPLHDLLHLSIVFITLSPYALP